MRRSPPVLASFVVSLRLLAVLTLVTGALGTTTHSGRALEATDPATPITSEAVTSAAGTLIPTAEGDQLTPDESATESASKTATSAEAAGTAAPPPVEPSATPAIEPTVTTSSDPIVLESAQDSGIAEPGESVTYRFIVGNSDPMNAVEACVTTSDSLPGWYSYATLKGQNEPLDAPVAIPADGSIGITIHVVAPEQSTGTQNITTFDISRCPGQDA